MGEIRPFTEEFAPAVAALYLRAMRGQSRPPSPALVQYFRDLLLRNPWAAPEIPSWVLLENNFVAAMLSVVPRPMVFQGNKVYAATLTQFMVDPEHRRSSAALHLLRRCFQGPQEFSWSDGSTDPVHALFTASGGHIAHFSSLHWMRILRPFSSARDMLSRRPNQILRAASSLLAPPGDLAAAVLPPFRRPSTALPYRSASVEEVFACIQEIGWRLPLKPHYEAASFAWLIGEVAKAEKGLGPVRLLLVQDPQGKNCGWIVYSAKRDGSASLLQLGTRRRDQFESVLRILFADAWDQDCALVRGTYSPPEHLTTLTANGCLLRHPGSSALIHSRNPELLNAVRLGEAALTGLDGERWQRFSVESWL